ncbi:thiamine pyrophosphate-binding protein [Achromobacter sp. Root565]|uniref:thiamine pyrophosphate-binding protein n=1 Tax=Achromobacter sp. Root565 TaxID=1736564 RepID=UPI0006FF7791|nr:thiamine pyrophosphate-binding protein [Achromobacter sp. Root565]KRA01785.1 pyruvate decarboxylase [Achromobacter sp. Root565]
MSASASATPNTSAHALIQVLAANAIDRVFVVPGESYLGVLDALHDFPGIDVVTCRHEGGAAFMACADARVTGRPGVVMVSRGPGAANAAIGVHAAQQDAVPMILLIGQVPKKDVRKEAFQEIDYQKMFGSMAKWVVEVTTPEELAVAAFKAVRVAMAGTPGPVVMVVPEDVQQALVDQHDWIATPEVPSQPAPDGLAHVHTLLSRAHKPLIIAGGGFNRPGGREALMRLAERHAIPVAVSFRQHDLFPNTHPLYAGDLDLSTPAAQVAALDASDLILALGTRLGDITTQGYTFPAHPRPRQTLVHCYPDPHIVNQHFAADVGWVADPTATAAALAELPATGEGLARDDWAATLRAIRERMAAWPDAAGRAVDDRIPFFQVVQALAAQAPADVAICLDAGTFAAPVYRHFPFVYPQRLLASQSGAMGYGTPAAVAAQLRDPKRRVVCMAGDGGFTMTGNEMAAAAERGLPILFIVANNNCYGSIRLHQARTYPGRYVGTDLASPDFTMMSRAFGIQSEYLTRADQLHDAIARGLASDAPYLLEVRSSLGAILPAGVSHAAGVDLAPRSGHQSL